VSLGDRMKEYENVYRVGLTKKLPVIIRLDGKAFHTFTRGMKKPFDKIMMETMQETMKYLCENIQGCVFGYTQSDEITLVLTDYATIDTDAWFGYSIQKMVSISASIATLEFNRVFKKLVSNLRINLWENCSESWNTSNEDYKYCELMDKATYRGAMFDSRVFTLPKDEVCNCLIWRQQDATRNSIESAGQSQFSHKELHKKTCNQIQEMLFSEKGINWNDYPTSFKRGSACYKVPVEINSDNLENTNTKSTVRNKWIVDTEIPIFTQDRDFIERWI